MTLPTAGTLIDLRSAELRFAQPLDGVVALPVVIVSLDSIENGTHALATLPPPLTVICERGVRSGLAARYLRADGLDAHAYPGGVPALLREVSG